MDHESRSGEHLEALRQQLVLLASDLDARVVENLPQLAVRTWWLVQKFPYSVEEAAKSAGPLRSARRPKKLHYDDRLDEALDSETLSRIDELLRRKGSAPGALLVELCVEVDALFYLRAVPWGWPASIRHAWKTTDSRTCAEYWVLRRSSRAGLPWHDSEQGHPTTRPALFQHVGVYPCEVSGASPAFAELYGESAAALRRAVVSDDADGTPERSAPAPVAVCPGARWQSREPRPVGRGEPAADPRPHAVYRLDERDDPDRLRNLVRNVIQKCREEDVLVLVLPELTVGPNFRRILEEELRAANAGRDDPRPVLTVAGSAHTDTDDGVLNEAIVLGPRGRIAEVVRATESAKREWRHHKLTHYIIHRTELAQLPEDDRRRWIMGLGLDDESLVGAMEPSKLGDEVLLVDTPIGSACVIICIDHLARSRHWQRPLDPPFVDWYWVPTASTKTNDFKAVDKDCALAGSAAVVANACWLLETFDAWGTGDAALVHAPGDALAWDWVRNGATGEKRAQRVAPWGEERMRGGRCSHADCLGCVWVLKPKPA